jgi:hypothetical protein
MHPNSTAWLGEHPSSLIVYIPPLPLSPLIPFPPQDRQFISVLYSAILLLLQLLYSSTIVKLFLLFSLLSVSVSVSLVVIPHIF